MLILLGCLLSGCAVVPVAGGSNESPAQARALAALARLHAPFQVTVKVADSARPAAWSWDDGRILITRGLVDLSSDDELAAVVAHELGHLYLARQIGAPRPPYMLRGSGFDEEERADAVACGLLAGVGILPSVLADALALVRDSAYTDQVLKARLSRRINWLASQVR